jgi:hypothetical protein
MKTTVYFEDFRNAFARADRLNQFSADGLFVLFNGLEDYEDSTGESIELDVISLCCDYTEMTELEIRDSYGLEDSQSSTEYLANHTWVLGTTPTTVIFQQF